MRRIVIGLVALVMAASIAVGVGRATVVDTYVNGSVSSCCWSGSAGFTHYTNNIVAFKFSSSCLPNTHYWLRVRYVTSGGSVWSFNDGPRGACGAAAGTNNTKPNSDPNVQAQCKIMHDSGFADISRDLVCADWRP